MTAGRLADSSPALGVVSQPTNGGGAVSPGRMICIDCTATGTCTMQFQDGNSITIHLQQNTVYVFPFAIIAITGGTATATYSNLK